MGQLTDKRLLELLDKRKNPMISTVSFMQLNVLKNELDLIKSRKEKVENPSIIEYLKRRIKELSE